MKKLLLMLPLLMVACNRTERPYDAAVLPSHVIFVSQQDTWNMEYTTKVIVNDRQTVTLKLDIPSRIDASNLSSKFNLKYLADTLQIPLQVSHKEYVSVRDNQVHTLITVKTTQPLNFEKGQYDTDFHVQPIPAADGKKRTLALEYGLELVKASEVLKGENLKLFPGDTPELSATIKNPSAAVVPAFVVRGSCHEDENMATFYQAIPEIPAGGSVQVNLKFRNGEKTLSAATDCNIWGARLDQAIAIE
ncbi:hypothetical protein [Deinococcus cellulosilyticus]|uniref:Uncharacterized protein n=1 Tax=Deinococcus cellulosilyticus (strain DSM 18568 / NBRC 106333 / KACC 11606 / 5516J-15) TaxID=1223518 RepID=A0A511N7V0_DEIC1|nr:hypothetical protein [Deinococcus cellulosilyticus]GEM48546.1 hypothetical protein DC3_41810 [Deinococcus cellulosilyticus NBRC 106333 = KACC 11606]